MQDRVLLLSEASDGKALQKTGAVVKTVRFEGAWYKYGYYPHAEANRKSRLHDQRNPRSCYKLSAVKGREDGFYQRIEKLRAFSFHRVKNFMFPALAMSNIMSVITGKFRFWYPSYGLLF